MHYRNKRLFKDIFLWAVFFHITGLSDGAATITRPGGSDQECEKLCRDEAEIDCNYYMYDHLKSMCTFASDPDPNIPDLKKLDEPDDDKKSADSWVTQLQARVLALEQKDSDNMNMHKAIAEMRSDIETLKAAREQMNHLIRTNKEQADQNIAAVDDKAELVEGDVKRVEDTVLTMGDMQKTLGNKVRQINEDLKSTGLTVTMLSQTSKDQRSTLRDIGVSITDIRTSISDLKKSVTDLQVRFAGLSTDVMEKVATVDTMIGPELRDLRYTQTTLAQALSLLTRKIMTIAPRIPELQKRISAKDGRFTAIDMQVQSLGRQVSFFSERLSFSEGQLKHIIDPASRMNIERRQNMLHIQGQMDTLITHQTRMENDLLAEVSDRSHIYKEISGLKLDRKSMMDQIVNQDDQFRDIKKTLRILIADEPRSMMVANVLSRQLAILRSMKRMREAQDDIHVSFLQYKSNVEFNQHEILKQIEVRRATDQALISMQTKLFGTYRNIKSVLEHDNTKMVLKNLINEHNDAVQRINKMRMLQQYMTEALLQNKWVIQSVRTGMQLENQHRAGDQVKLATVQKGVEQLHNTMVSYKFREEVNKPLATAHMVRVIQKQNEILGTLSQYRMDLQRTQTELNDQKNAQLKQSWKSLVVLQELQAVQRTLTALMDRENLRTAKLNSIHALVSAHLEKQSKEVSKDALMIDIHNAVAHELEKQAARERQRSPNQNQKQNEPEHDPRFLIIKKQQQENEALKQDIRHKQELLDYMQRRNMT